MESKILQRVFALSSSTTSNDKLEAAGSVIRTLKHGKNPAAKGGSIAEIIGALPDADQEAVVAAVESLTR